MIDAPARHPAPAPSAPPAMAPADAMGSTMTMAPIGAPPAAGPPRPGSGPQPVYPPQSGMAPPPPPPEAKSPASGVLAALKGLGGRKATTPAAAGPEPRPGAAGPGPLSIDDAHRRPGGSVPLGTVAPGPMGAGRRPGGPSRQSGSRPPGAGLMVAIGIAGLALGVIIGVVVTAGQQADANQAISDAQNIRSQMDEARAEIEADQAQVDKRRDEVAEREKALGDREAQVKEQEAALKQQQEQQQQQQEQQEQEQEENGNGNGNGTVFYWNCDAVRAAGAAPLPNTAPGYLPHLDRNGNGIACEDGE
ncbi:excalibur calcium-binding domain-containing protein [Promicromonospora sp. MEB111]|uniref:excalibur calcium-binding domain-containing protein n=1 Tax=Promicromonospora sp. MEB111 TaxID=3040301 RepID=UPI00254BF4A3|nr:excalibur calcium-binding domain-containing protein [Promicromonospora sp. MEB111]